MRTLTLLVILSGCALSGCAAPRPVLYSPGAAQMVSEPMREPMINPSAIRAAEDQREREERFKANACPVDQSPCGSSGR